MAEQDKDLPLVVAETLTEMHGMNTRLTRVEDVLIQVVDNIQQLSAAVKPAAEQDAKRQEGYNRHFQLLQEADERNRELLATALQNTIAAFSRRVNDLEDRVDSLENR